MTNTTMIDSALDYAKKGWPVFPCRANKAPYTDNGVLAATTNKQQIREWWAKWPRANIGMDVGAANMVVIDLDPGHDWAQLEKNIGKLPETGLVQNTPRGGQHLFFAKDREELIPASASKVADHVDVRSHHSYVLLAPSRTKDGEYTWLKEGRPAYRTDKFLEAAQAYRERSDNYDTWIIEPDIEENIALATKWLKNDSQIAVEGAGGDQMAYNTAAMMKSFGLSPETAFELIWEHWNPRCDPPWDIDEIEHLERKIENGYTYNTSPPGNMTPAYRVAKAQAQFQAVSRDTIEGHGKEYKNGRFRAVDRDAMDYIKSPEWLIKDAIPEGSYSMLIGPRGTFKTFVALDMALSIAVGGADYWDSPADWEGTWPDITNSGAVVFVAGEGRASILSRVAAWEKHHLDRNKVENFYLVDPVPAPNETDAGDFLGLIDAVVPEDQDIKLVVIDTVGRAMQGMNENSQQDASQFTRMVQSIQYELDDCAVLAIHHTGLGEENQTRARGSSVFGADVDAEFILKREDKSQYVAMFNTKQKDAPEWSHPKIINVKPHGQSLVAVAVKKDQAQSIAKQFEPKDQKNKTRATAKEKAMKEEVIRRVAFEILKSRPAKQYTRNALANAIAAHKEITDGATNIRKNYMDCLMTNKKKAVSRCFDPDKGVYVYHPRRGHV